MKKMSKIPNYMLDPTKGLIIFNDYEHKPEKKSR